jgi:hypothetical protein
MKNLTAAATVLSISMSFGSSAFALNDGGCLEGCEPPPPPECLTSCEPEKGNNGWGNGPDTTNAGSFSGKTAVTKSVNGLGVDKFDGKFEGR